MRNLVFIRALRRVDGRNSSVHQTPPPRNNISMAYMKSLVRHDPCTIYICTRARLLMSKPSRKNQLTGQCAWNAPPIRKQTKAEHIAVRHKRNSPNNARLSVALIVESVHINVGRGAGLVLLCLSLASR